MSAPSASQTLPAGDYVLEVAAKGVLSGWNYEGLRMPVVVHPPWWNSPAAYAGYIALAVLVIGLIVLFYQRNLKQALLREQELALRVARAHQRIGASDTGC